MNILACLSFGFGCLRKSLVVRLELELELLLLAVGCLCF